MKANMIKMFNEIYGENENLRVFFSPGRVNLIGEHTDYNGGNVFPCALSFGTYGAIALRNDKTVRMYSDNFKDLGIITFNIDELVNDEKHDWANYPKGVIDIMRKHGYNVESGFDMVVFGNIPNGAGLSSSASIELLMAVIANDLFNFNLDRVELVKYCQEAENKFIGVNCGIMDQFAIGMGKENSAILLDCNTLNYSYSPVDLKEEVIIIANTNKRRGLADSKYNERRSECERALSNLQTKLNVKALGELTEEEFEANKELIENEVDRKRAKHAVYENQRTLKAVKALEENNLELFGQLMVGSHVSLRDDYEVTGIELDTLVSLALKQDGVIGARMTGAGFGGCTVSIVRNENVGNFIENVTKGYEEEIGYAPTFYVANISSGTRKIG